MLKQSVLGLLCIPAGFLGATHAHAQGDFTITGKLSVQQQGVVMISYSQYINGKEVYKNDSSLVKDGQFIMKGTVNYPVLASISFYPPNRNNRSQGMYRNFYLEPTGVMIEGGAGLDQALIKGGKAQQTYAAWQERRKLLNDSITKIFAPGHDLGAAMNGEAVRELQRQGAPIQKRLDKIDSAFIADNPDSQAAYDLRFKRALTGELNLKETEADFNRFTQGVRSSTPGVLLNARLQKLKMIQPGHPAPDFTFNDLSGKPVSLSSYKGKYLLLVFSNYTGSYGLDKLVFNLTRAYNGIKTDGFAILTVSNDAKSEAVKEVAVKNGMNWAHVLRNEKEGSDPVGEKYDVDPYGAKAFLIGPDGNFLMTDLTLARDLATQIKKNIPGAEKSLTVANKKVADKAPLNVFVGDEITSYPQVEWLKGGPVTKFDKDKIYIVELWATWCVPCIAAMPHLSDLQRKFKDKNVIIIAQGVWEEDKAKAENFVKTKGTDLDYLVAFSGPNGSEFDKRWCIPAQVTGIPQTFVIQNGRLVWQTYPTNLNDDILQLLIDKKFTIEKAEALITKR